MDNAKQIKWGAALSYLSIGLNLLAGLIYTPWMISQIGKSDYGLYTLATSLISLFLLDFGLSSATGRYVSKYRAENNQEKVNNFLGAVYKLYLVIDAVILIVLIGIYFFIDNIYVNLTPIELEKFKKVYLIAALYSVINFPFVTLNGILNSYEKFIQLKLADVIYRFLVVGLTVVALLYGLGLYALVAVNAVAGLTVILYKLIIIQKTTSVKVNFKYFDKALYKDIFGFSAWITIITIMQRLIFNITPSILGIVANSASIAVFGIISTIEGYTYTITSAINGMFMPKISRIYTKEDWKDNLNALTIKVGRFQAALNGLIIIAFAIVGRLFIKLWMGEDYMDAYYGILLVIIPGFFFNSLQIANTAMIVQKKVNLQAYVSIIVGVVNIILSPILSKYFGVIGACVSIFVAYTIRSVLYFVIYYRTLKIDMWEFVKKCYLSMVLPFFITLLIGFVFCSYFHIGGWMEFIVEGGVLLLVYCVSMFGLALSRKERQKICKEFTYNKEKK